MSANVCQNASAERPGSWGLRQRLMTAARLTLFAVVFLAAACSRFSAVDKPLTQWTPGAGEVSDLDSNNTRSPEIAVLLAFSGGGSRASALSYGVLKELAESSIATAQGPSNVLAEVDMISAVSGGVSRPRITDSRATACSMITKSGFCARM